MMIKKKRTLMKKKKKSASSKKTLTVLFVPRTIGGGLAKKLREADKAISELTGDKIKIVERAGVKLRHLLVRSNPWDNQKCQYKQCLVCSNPNNKKFGCDKRNVTYKTYCLECKSKAEKNDADDKHEQLQTYYGETHLSGRERGAGHIRDYQTKNDTSHMLKHASEAHPDDIENVKFGMTIIKQHFSSFSRQIHEAVLIFNDPFVLNSKSEYNMCQVPRLSVMFNKGEINNDNTEEKKKDYDENALDTEINILRNKKHLKLNYKGRKKLKKETVKRKREDDNNESEEYEIKRHKASSKTDANYIGDKEPINRDSKPFPLFIFNVNPNAKSKFQFNATKGRDANENDPKNPKQKPKSNDATAKSKSRKKTDNTTNNNKSIRNYFKSIMGPVAADSSDPPV